MCRKIENCEGYIWRSDAETPVIITSSDVVELNNGEIPFVIEGQLFDGKTSYSIKNVDGNYIVNEYTVNGTDYNHVNIDKKHYQSHRMEGRILEFLEYWEPQEDPLCLGMEVLKPTKVVFVGFKEEEEK